MPSRWDSATCGRRRRVFHYPPPTLMSRNYRLPCAVELQPLSLTPLKMRKVELRCHPKNIGNANRKRARKQYDLKYAGPHRVDATPIDPAQVGSRHNLTFEWEFDFPMTTNPFYEPKPKTRKTSKAKANAQSGPQSTKSRDRRRKAEDIQEAKASTSHPRGTAGTNSGTRR